MSEHRNGIARVAASSTRRRRRWMSGVVAVLGASGLALGGLGVPVSANDLNTTGNLHASADVQGDCVTAAAGTGQAEESVKPQQDSELQATGQGTATVSVCGDAMGGTPPGDPDDPMPGNLDDVVPSDVGGLVPDGHGLVRNLLDRLAQINPPALGGGGSNGDDGDGPAMKPSPNGTASGSVDVGGASADANAEGGSLTGSAPGGEPVSGKPGLAGATAASGGSLPRTGGGLGVGVLRLIAFLGLGRALFRLAMRRYSDASDAGLA